MPARRDAGIRHAKHYLTTWLGSFRAYHANEEADDETLITLLIEQPQLVVAQKWASRNAASDDLAALLFIACDGVILLGLGFVKPDLVNEGQAVRDISGALEWLGDFDRSDELLEYALSIAHDRGDDSILQPTTTLHVTSDGRMGIGVRLGRLGRDASGRVTNGQVNIGRLRLT